MCSISPPMYFPSSVAQWRCCAGILPCTSGNVGESSAAPLEDTPVCGLAAAQVWMRGKLQARISRYKNVLKEIWNSFLT